MDRRKPTTPWLLLVLSALLFPGCTDPEPPTYGFGFQYSNEATEEDRDEVQAIADEYDARMLISYTGPAHVVFFDMSLETCEAVWQEIHTRVTYQPDTLTECSPRS
jgi:hypothetical protein